jgi:hypothetical protein
MRFCGACGQPLALAAPTGPADFAATVAHGGAGGWTGAAAPVISAEPQPKRRFAGTVLGMAAPVAEAEGPGAPPSPTPTFTAPAAALPPRQRTATAGYYDAPIEAGPGRKLPAAASRHYGMGTLGVPPDLVDHATIARSSSTPSPRLSTARVPAAEPLTPWWRRRRSSVIVLGAFLAGVVLTVSIMVVAVGAYLARREAPAPASDAHVGR